MADVIYNSFKGRLDGSIDWDSDTINIMLVTDVYTPDIDTHLFIDDVSNEITGTGYTAGGAVLANASIAIDTTNDLAKYDGDDVIWASSTITAYGAVIYKDTGTPSTSPLVAYIDFGADKSSSGGDFKIVWDANGIFTIA